MPKRFLFLLLLLPAVPALSQQTLSDRARISVITCGPWQGELYSAFGHSAIRVHDPAQGIDEAYNYGVFDFDQPNFYLNFARGYLYYKLGVYNYQDFKNYYIYHNRYIHEQLLNLTIQQKQRLYDSLQWNALPANETYRYDYFYNNCATKIRDIVIAALGDSVRFDGSYIHTQYTIRDLTDIYLSQQPWGDLGIDICLGLPMDKKATAFEYMFLPDYIESGFNHATILTDSSSAPLVQRTIPVYEERPADAEKGLPHPLYFFGILCLLAIALSVFDILGKRTSKWFDTLLFSIAGLIGLLLLFLWVATDHKAAANNFNILWALPTHVVAVVALLRNATWVKTYFSVIAVLQIVLLLLWFVLPQELNYSLIPVVLALAVRALTQSSWLKQRVSQ